MVTVKVAPKLSEGCPPSGSIVLGDLVRRYLVFIGLKRFRSLSVPELQQFALLTLYRVIPKRGLEGMDVETFWKWLRPDGSFNRARLLPDTEEGHRYHAEQSEKRLRKESFEETVILHVDDVRRFMRKAFIRLILEDVRVNNIQKKVQDKLEEVNAPSMRRGTTGNGNYQALDEILRHMREQRVDANIEAVRFVVHLVEEKMRAQDLQIVHLLNDGNKPQDVADVLDLNVQEIYQTHRTYKSNCRKVWGRLFGPT